MFNFINIFLCIYRYFTHFCSTWFGKFWENGKRPPFIIFSNVYLSEALSSNKASTDREGKPEPKDTKGSKRLRETKTYNEYETTPTSSQRRTRRSLVCEQNQDDKEEES